VELIRHWKVIEGDYTLAPGGPATRFVDPPYVGSGHHYPHGSRGIDYQELGAWCHAQEGQAIVCENVGADWLPFRPWRVLKSTMGRPGSAEAIWSNDEIV